MSTPTQRERDIGRSVNNYCLANGDTSEHGDLAIAGAFAEYREELLAEFESLGERMAAHDRLVWSGRSPGEVLTDGIVANLKIRALTARLRGDE